MPGASKGTSSSPNAGAAQRKGNAGRVGGSTAGGNKTTSKSPNAGAAKTKRMG